VGDDIFERIKEIYIEKKDYLLSTEMKKYDSDPFLDDRFQIITM
jgi:hypothetical protein